jgi:hypothetical protein
MAKTVSSKKSLVAMHLAAGLPVQAVADQVGLSTRTIDRYKRDPEFAGEVVAIRRRLEDDVAGNASARLSAMLTTAIDVHARLLQSKSERIQAVAVKLAYDARRQAVELENVLTRLTALEQAQADAE